MSVAIHERKTSQLQIRVTPRQKARIKRFAGMAGLDMSTWVLSRLMPSPDEEFHDIVARLATSEEPDLVIQDLFNLLTDLTRGEFPLAVQSLPRIDIPQEQRSVVAALVEHAATVKGCTSPTWVGIRHATD